MVQEAKMTGQNPSRNGLRKAMLKHNPDGLLESIVPFGIWKQHSNFSLFFPLREVTKALFSTERFSCPRWNDLLLAPISLRGIVLSERCLVCTRLVTDTHGASPFRETAADKSRQGCNQAAVSGTPGMCLVFCERRPQKPRGCEDPAGAASRLAEQLEGHMNSEWQRLPGGGL